LRWWDRWLRGEANGAEAGPSLTLFVQGSGLWRQEEDWPPRRNEMHTLYLAPGQLLNRPPADQADTVEPYRCDPTVGLDSISADPWTAAVLELGEHNGDDALSLCFTSDALSDDWELTGEASVGLALRASMPGLTYVAKLCDVQPSGRSRLVTMGWSPGPV